jgi:hypothetical protein
MIDKVARAYNKTIKFKSFQSGRSSAEDNSISLGSKDSKLSKTR